MVESYRQYSHERHDFQEHVLGKVRSANATRKQFAFPGATARGFCLPLLHTAAQLMCNRRELAAGPRDLGFPTSPISASLLQLEGPCCTKFAYLVGLKASCMSGAPKVEGG